MMHNFEVCEVVIIFLFLLQALSFLSFAEEPVKPFQTFVTLESYSYLNPNPEAQKVSMEISLPEGKTQKIPSQESWEVTPGKEQVINQTLEIPFESIKKDAFRFTIQIFRSGTKLGPCNFEIKNISEYNRTYICHLAYSKKASEEKDTLHLRVHTDRIPINTDSNEQLALQPE